jgi:glycerol-3-phosphate acyltransferase PlsY
LGVMIAISPLLGLAALVTWVIVFAFSRYASLASIVAALFVPIHSYYYLRPYKDFFFMLLVLSGLLIWRHRGNIKKLLNGTEDGFKKKK